MNNESIASIDTHVVFVFIFTYLSIFKEMNMKYTYFFKQKPTRTLMQADCWEFYTSPLRKKTYMYVLSLGMPPSMGVVTI